jgi:1-acyl-sn-glycerol-3-phosphate acyltransferase
MDHFFVGMFIRRKVRYITKSQMFKPPLQWILYNGAAIPVRRGQRDNEVFITAETVLAQGGCLLIYCEGGRSRTGELSQQVKPGIGRLALESGAPVVPIAIHGSAKVRNWKRLQLPRVKVQYGDPIQFKPQPHASREHHQMVAEQIFDEVRLLYQNLDSKSR